MLSTNEGITKNSKMSVDTLGTTKKPSARNLLCQCSELFDGKQKTTVCKSGASKMKCKETTKGH